MSNFYAVFLYGILAGISTILGMYIVLFREAWARKNTIYLISFSAGVLISVALSQLMPEAISLETNALMWFLFSFVFFYILEHSIIMHSCHEGETCEVHPIDRIALIGMGFHSLLDGLIIGIGFEISSFFGIIATITVLLHKLPDGISMVSILLHSEYKRRKAINYSWIVAAATPVGAIIGYLLVKDVPESVLGILIAIAAGSFLYVSAADLIPEIHKKSKILNIVLVILGVLFPFIIGWLIK